MKHKKEMAKQTFVLPELLERVSAGATEEGGAAVREDEGAAEGFKASQ